MGTIAGDELAGWEPADEALGGGIDGGTYGGPGDGGSAAGLERFLVSVRIRPLNEKETANRDPSEWGCSSGNTVIFKGSNVHDRSLYPASYTFDRVFSPDCNTRKVYEQGAKAVALSVVSGINASIFAYGQTSSGKTYTMSGITEYSMADIYDYIEKHPEREFVLKFSAMEIYNEAVRDLLSTDTTPLRLLDDPERGTIVEKLTEETLRDWNHLKELLSICEAQRQIGETSLNETSSRSHQILRLTIESSSRKYLGKESASTLAACVNFVDLAGSERASQAMSAGARLKEGCHINRSLLTLGTVIRKLSKGRNGHVPYRDSKLTRILQLSLGGNARTAIICTMSPARSHMEQSRNTLLFACCAKEVVTNAQVNVVMSDKALVKHLQKELARLENELRRPGSFSETLLKEKENQIYKMEREIKMLIQQRDVAQSQLDSLLQSVKDGQAPRQLFCQFPAFHLSGGSIDLDSMSETSSVACNDHLHSRKIVTSQESASFSGIPNVHYPEKSNIEDRISPRQSISSPSFMGLLIDGNEDITLDNNEEFEDLCKDVQCIEMDETSMSRSLVPYSRENTNLSSLPADISNLKDEEVISNADSDKDKLHSVTIPEIEISSMKRKIEVDKKLNFVEPYCEELSSRHETREYCGSRKPILSRSRSCRASITHNMPSPWFVEEEQNETTPPSWSVKQFPGRPEGFPRRTITLNYHAGSRTPSEVSRSSESIATIAKANYEENISRVSDFVAGMKEMVQTHQTNEIPDCKELKVKVNGDIVAKSTRDMSVDANVYPNDSPSRFPHEFEKQQRKIIALWHECNISLVHRTYFFFLFKGDPEDSVYMEVELRRLSFLKNSFSQGGSCKHPLGDGFIATPASSMKALRREREKLCRLMQKRLSAAERESLFRKWRIPLDSKQRRMQLARLIWSNTTDMEQIRESASVVAKLVGLQESGPAMKEMYGLSFGPQKTTRRAYSWT